MQQVAGLPIFLAYWPIGLLATEFHPDVTDDTNLPERSLILHLAI